MKKIVWFYYKEDSVLDNTIIKGINYTLLGILFGYPFITTANVSVTLSYIDLIAIIVGSPMLAGFCEGVVEKNTTFYEWDYTERKKKRRFLGSYRGISTVLSACLILSICIAYKALCDEDTPIGLKIFALIPPFVFIFNLANIPTLFYFVFEDDLRQEYKIQRKPENWQDEGKEIKREDEIEEIMERDWGIHR